MRRGIQYGQMLVACVVGITSGIYLFSPKYFVEYREKYAKKVSTEEESN